MRDEGSSLGAGPSNVGNRLLILFDERHSASEPRHHALGVTITGRYLHIVFTMRDRMTRIRVISARPMHRRERRFYASQDN